MDHVPSRCEHDADGRNGGAILKRRLLLALTLVLAAGFAALGVWQVERLGWKRDLIARVEARVHAPPVAPRLHADPRAEEYRRVQVTGTFDHSRETFVQALTERGAGFWVLTPLRTSAGTLLVNRGFVPPGKRPPATRAAGQSQGPVTITGLLRVSEPGGGFLRANDPAQDRWYSRDVEAIARARGLGPVAPFFIDAGATPPGGYPVGGLTVVRFRDHHLIYALTWFGLAALSLVGTFLILRKPRHG